jgi:hypothetical protein
VVCSSGVGFNPVVDGQRHFFEIFGLFNAVMVMNDKETGSIWTHIGGEAVDGPLEGASMKILPMQQVSWEKWREVHPDTLVLSDDTPYKEFYRRTGMGTAGLGPEFVASIVYWDTRLPENQVVLGVNVGDSFRAYPVHEIVFADGVLNDTLEDEPIVLIVDGDSAFSAVYSRKVAGEELNFDVADGQEFALMDRETGSIWNIEGQATAGPLEGESLTFVTSFLAEWYGWSAYHPETGIFGAAP